MKRTTLALAVSGAAVAAAIPLTGAGAQAPGPRTVTVVEVSKGSVFHFIDTAPLAKNRNNPRPSTGDAFTLSIPLNDEAGKRVGRLSVHCSITKGGAAARVEQLCTASFRLADGEITAVTSFVGEPKLITGAVTGGDGAYAGARGTFTSENNESGNNKDVLTLLG